MQVFTEDLIEYLEETKYKEKPEVISALKLHNELLNNLCYTLIYKEPDKRNLVRLTEELEENLQTITRLMRKV